MKCFRNFEKLWKGVFLEFTQESHLKSPASNLGIAIGSLLLTAGMRFASKRVGALKYMGWIGPAIMLYSYYRRHSHNSMPVDRENELH
jgi:hypothetical protein